MNSDEILEAVKWNIGITTNIRDDYLKLIIEGAEAELNGSGITPDNKTENYKSAYYAHLVAFCAWLYRTRGSDEPLPAFLRLQRNNLIIHECDNG